MNQMLGLAGIAEAALAYEALILGGSLAASAILIGVGLMLRSWKLELLPLGMLVLFAIMVQPWLSFLPVESNDGDVPHWVAIHRALAIVWGILALGVIACFLVLRAGRNERGAQPLRSRSGDST